MMHEEVSKVLREALEARGMSQRDVADATRISQSTFNQVLMGKRPITAEQSVKLGALFDWAPDRLIRAQKEADLVRELAEVPSNVADDVRERWRLFSQVPVRDIVDRGWVRDGHLHEDIERLLACRPKRLSARKSIDGSFTPYNDHSPAQIAWVARVAQLARTLNVGRYSKDALLAALPSLRRAFASTQGLSVLARRLGECGVRLVIVETIAGAKIDGVALWLDETSPVIGLSLRHNRIDSMAFTLAHEICHVLERHDAGVDEDIESHGERGALPPAETQANEFAQGFFVPRAAMEEWIKRRDPFFSHGELMLLAAQHETHPGIVAGQLRWTTKRFNLFARHLEKVREELVHTAITDGWGKVPTLANYRPMIGVQEGVEDGRR